MEESESSDDDDENPPESFDEWVEGKSAAESNAVSSGGNFVSETPKPIGHANYLEALADRGGGGGLDAEWLNNMLEDSLGGRDAAASSRSIKSGNQDFDKFVEDLRKMQS